MKKKRDLTFWVVLDNLSKTEWTVPLKNIGPNSPTVQKETKILETEDGEEFVSKNFLKSLKVRD